jgi:hypothetical protein
VGMREALPTHRRWAPGCFVRYARYHVASDHTAAQICNLQANAIQAVRADGCASQPIIEKTDHFAGLKFNKWMLDTVCRDDGTTLHLHKGGRGVNLLTLLTKKTATADFKCIKQGPDDWILMA